MGNSDARGHRLANGAAVADSLAGFCGAESSVKPAIPDLAAATGSTGHFGRRSLDALRDFAGDHFDTVILSRAKLLSSRPEPAANDDSAFPKLPAGCHLDLADM